MSEQKGILLTCNRCGKSIFLKYLGEVDGSNYSGGPWSKYEDRPQNWIRDSHFGDLCPDCAFSFDSFLKDFFGSEKYPNLAPGWKYKPEVDENV